MEKGRKRKVQIQESESESKSHWELESELSTSSIQLKTRRLSPDNSDSSAANSTCETDGPDHVSASCSSSNGAGELAKGSSQSVDLEENLEAAAPVEFFATSSGDSLDCTEERRETTPTPTPMGAAESGELESTAMPDSRRRTTTAEKMPSEDELDEFFTAAEKNLQKKFIDRYNYDIVTDQPLEGRYEWVQIQLIP